MGNTISVLYDTFYIAYDMKKGSIISHPQENASGSPSVFLAVFLLFPRKFAIYLTSIRMTTSSTSPIIPYISLTSMAEPLTILFFNAQITFTSSVLYPIPTNSVFFGQLFSSPLAVLSKKSLSIYNMPSISFPMSPPKQAPLSLINNYPAYASEKIEEGCFLYVNKHSASNDTAQLCM